MFCANVLAMLALG